MMRPCLLLTGATGFLGQATVRQWAGRGKIYLLVRDNENQTAAERFKPVGEQLKSEGVVVEYEVLSCNLADENLGLEEDVLAKVLGEVSHVLNCAGNVRFDLQPGDAIENNVETAVNVARFAARCKGIGKGRLVHVSTAYVSPPKPSGGLESPGISATDLGYKESQGHHHNTYTWSKCIAEHHVSSIANERNLSLSIVRPSMIGPAWASPYPGWCPGKGSPSQNVGMLYGAGVLRVMQRTGANNIIPVDWVAKMMGDALLRDDTIKFYTATVPPSYAYHVRDSIVKYHFEDYFNCHPKCQYRAMHVIYADGVLARALELLMEDSHALVLKMLGRKKAFKLITRALNARDMALKPYASETWRFDPQNDTGSTLWPQKQSDFSDQYAKMCCESAADALKKFGGSSPVPRMGNLINGIVAVCVLAAIACIYWVSVHAPLFIVNAYKEELASFDPHAGSALFHWSPFGGMFLGRKYGHLTAAALAMSQPILYALVLWITTKYRPRIPSPGLSKWLFAHNVVMSLFSGSIVVLCALEMHFSSVSNGPWYCSTVETRMFDLIQIVWIMSKVYEWVDTIFLLLNHKSPIPLHLWHHCSTSVFFGLLSQYSHLSKIGILMNGSIHFVMYAHYARPFPRAWRSWITKFQIAQFATSMIWAMAGVTCFVDGKERMFSQLVGHCMVGSYLVMFLQFYLNDQARRKERRQQLKKKLT